MNKNTKLILMAGGAIALTYALMEYFKKNVKGDTTPLPQVPETDPTRASSFTAGDDFFANYVSDDFFGFTANEPFMNAGGLSLGFDGSGKAKEARLKNRRPILSPPKGMGKRQKRTNNDINLNFTASDNFFNAGGIPIATDEPNFKH